MLNSKGVSSDANNCVFTVRIPPKKGTHVVQKRLQDSLDSAT